MGYNIIIRDGELKELHRATSEDRVLTGRQLIERAVGPDKTVADYLVLALGPDNQLEDVDLEEVQDLSNAGQFFLFSNDRSFNFLLNQRRQPWGESKISAKVLRYLAGLQADDKRIIFQELRHKEDQPLDDPSAVVELSAQGLEVFYVGPGATTAGLIDVLPETDQRYLRDHIQLNAQVVDSSGQTGLVFKAFALPEQKFDQENTDILIVLPSSYPDASPDMFFCDPWLRSLSTGRWPAAADHEYMFAGRRWQRWSRHYTDSWDAAIHGIHIVIQRVRAALRDTP